MSSDAQPSAGPVRTCLIGCGAVAQQMYARHLPQIPGLRMVMVSDLRPENAQRVAAAMACATGTAAEAFAAASLAIIATPPASHAALARQALAAGCDVIVEKPFTISSAEAAQLVAQAEQAGRRIYVAQFRRLYPKLEQARQVIGSGLLGQVRAVEMYEGGRFDWEVATDYINRDPYGGVLFDTGAHTLDMGLHAAGLDTGALDVRVVSVRRDRPEPAHEIEARFVLRTDGRDIEGRLHLSRARALANLVRVRGERGQLEFDVSHAGGLTLTAGGRRIPVFPGRQVESARHAFTLQYHQLVTAPDNMSLAARGFINQISILEAVYHHE